MKITIDQSRIRSELFHPQEKQNLLITSPCTNVFYGGARGGGKTHGMGLDFISRMQTHCHEHKTPFKGLIVRKQIVELEDIIKSYRQLFAGFHAYNINSKEMQFPEEFNHSILLFKYIASTQDAEYYQGHQYHYIYVEEMGNYESPAPIDMLKGCLRGSNSREKCYFRASGNPGGLGHNWIKERYVTPSTPGLIFNAEVKVNNEVIKEQRQYIPSTLVDNKYFDENYRRTLVIACQQDPELLKAWLYGDWDIVRGGSFFSHSFRAEHNIIPQVMIYDENHKCIIDENELAFCCSFDWGNTQPYSIGFYLKAVRDTEVLLVDKTIRHLPMGSIIRFGEIYGWNGKPNEGLPEKTNSQIAQEILDYYKTVPMLLD